MIMIMIIITKITKITPTTIINNEYCLKNVTVYERYKTVLVEWNQYTPLSLGHRRVQTSKLTALFPKFPSSKGLPLFIRY